MPIVSPQRKHRLALATTLIAASVGITFRLSAQVQASDGTSKTTSPPQTLRFEVSSVRPHTSADEGSSRRVLPGGRFIATGTSVRTLIRIAFGTDDRRIAGAPGWAGDETFDISATTADHLEINTPQQFQEVILSLLVERFRFKFHQVREEGAVFRLELDKPGKLGQELKPSGPDLQPNMSVNSNGSRTTMKASKISMADFAAALQKQAGRPVEDHTGLQGGYNFEIKWAPEPTPDSADPSLTTVLHDELGLKLRPAKGIVETLVVDQIEHPSEN